MKKGDEIRGLVREIENRVEAGILPDGNCIFDPLRVRLAFGVCSVCAGARYPGENSEVPGENSGKQLTVI